MKRTEPLITVRQNKRTSFKTLSQMSGDDIQTLKRTKKSEISHEALCYNIAANRALKKQLSQWHREHNIVLGNIKRGQHSVYKTMLRVNMDKKRLQYEAYKKEQEKYRVIMSQNRDKINLMVLDKLPKSETPQSSDSGLASHHKEEVEKEQDSSTHAKSGIISKCQRGVENKDLGLDLNRDLSNSRGFYLSTSSDANIYSGTATSRDLQATANTYSSNKQAPPEVQDLSKIDPPKGVENKDKVSAPDNPSNDFYDNRKNAIGNDTHSDTIKGKFERKSKTVEVTKDLTKPLVREKSEGKIELKNSKQIKLPPLGEKELPLPQTQYSPSSSHATPDITTTPKDSEVGKESTHTKTTTKPDILKIEQRHNKFLTDPSLRKLSVIDEQSESSPSSMKCFNLNPASDDDNTPSLSMCKHHKKHATPLTLQQNDAASTTSPSLSTFGRKNSVSSTGTNTDKKFSFVEYNKRKRKERERKMKEALSGLPPIYVRDERGNVVPHLLEFKRTEFKLPSNKKKRQLQQLRDAEMQHENHIGDKLHDFHQKYIKEDDMRKQALREAAEQKKTEEPDPSKSEAKPTRMLSLGAAWSTALANTTAKFMKSDLDPNSSEGLKQCGYLRRFDVDLKYEMKSKGESYTKKSSWKSEPVL